MPESVPYLDSRPREAAGFGLCEGPATLVFHRVVASAAGPAVDRDGLPAAGVIAGVIQIGGGGAAPAADADAMPVPHLDMPAQRGVGEAPVRVLVQCGAGLLAVGPTAGDALQDPGPLGVVGGQRGN